jgi:hypothetical protein
MGYYEELLTEALAKLEIQAKTCKAAQNALGDIQVAYQNIWTCEDEEGTEEYDYFVCCSVMGFIDQENLKDEPYYRDIAAVFKIR